MNNFCSRSLMACCRYDMKVNLMVRQIFQKAEMIEQNMTETWSKLDDLESSYQQMILKIHRLQSNRVCLGLLTGKDYPGESHPTQVWYWINTIDLFWLCSSNQVKTFIRISRKCLLFQCPCSAVAAKEAEDLKRQEERRRIEQEVSFHNCLGEMRPTNSH